MAPSIVNMLCMSIVCLVLLLGANSSPKVQAVVTCNQVVGNLAPCVSYIRNGGRIVPQQCCNGIRNLSSMARSTPDRQSVCNCIKSTVRGIPYTSFNLNLANGLPQRCGVSIPYQINPSTDCSRVHWVDDLWISNSRRI